ncbi:MAG: CDP-diacylglycerol--serine O-phosphatidyltransferase [Myxococcota bacterium]|nr:CDP-diacylglycerol--serine O-phosphatidyltransferase [Myxococcota bacterium]MEC9390758.1 CDP-diacylglycerol--serine O-phosphatidyltransferase [Myxococcota bacterium]
MERTVLFKYLVPNGFTALSMVFGFASIVLSASGDFVLAGWLILWGVMLDKLDGGAARLLNASSEFGAEMDSFADFVAFGLAPAALVFFSVTGGHVEPGEGMKAGACAVYALAVAIRLARFNVSEPEGEGADYMFVGVPSTLCGGCLAAAFLTAESQGVSAAVMPWMPAALVVGGALMVSNLRIPKFSLRWSKPVNALQIANMVVCYTLVPLQKFPEWLFFSSFSFLLFGLCYGMVWSSKTVNGESGAG